MRPLFALLLIFLFLCLECQEKIVDSPLKVNIKTEGTTALYDTWAEFNIKNAASRPAYLHHNINRVGFWKFEKAFKDSWIDVSTDTSFCRWFSTTQMVRIEPGETYHDSVLILRAGRYRISFPFSWDEYETETEEVFPEEFDVE